MSEAAHETSHETQSAVADREQAAEPLAASDEPTDDGEDAEVGEAIEVREGAAFADLERVVNLPRDSVRTLGLEFRNPDLPMDEWIRIGQVLGQVDRWGEWAVGDWLNFGLALYGDQAFQATEGTTKDRYDMVSRVTGLAYQTLRNYSWVAGRVPMSRRRPEFGVSIHEAVAALEPDEQVEWLQRAADNGWTRATLRQAINASKALPAPAAEGAVEVLPPAPERLSAGEQLEVAARLVYERAQPATDGSMIVPPDAWAQLAAALGEE